MVPKHPIHLIIFNSDLLHMVEIVASEIGETEIGVKTLQLQTRIGAEILIVNKKHLLIDALALDSLQVFHCQVHPRLLSRRQGRFVRSVLLPSPSPRQHALQASSIAYRLHMAAIFFVND